MNLYSLPTTVTIEEQSITIRNKGDFRMVLDCFSALNDLELSETERVYASLIIFYEDINSLEDLGNLGYNINELVKEMYGFFNMYQPDNSNTSNVKLLDWNTDAPIIISAINNVARKEIRSDDYLHWWTFLGYYMSIGESILSQVVSIRSKIAKNKKLEQYEKDFKRDNPQYFNFDMRTQAQKEDEEWLKKMWNV